MKVLYIHQHFRTPQMSGGTRSYEFAKRLAKNGHEVVVIAAMNSDGGNSKSSWHKYEIEGFTVFALSVPYSNSMGFYSRLKAFFYFAVLSTFKCRKIDADIVFATSTPLTVAIPAVAKSLLHKVPLVFEVRDLWPEIPIAMGILNNPLLKWLARKLEKVAYFNSKAIVTLSPGMREGVLRAGFDTKRVCVIPNACDTSLFQSVKQEDAQEFRNQRSWLRENPLVLYAGTLGVINNVEYLVDLAKELLTIDNKIRFLVLGDGKQWDSISNKAEQLGVLGKNFFMEKPVSKEEIPIVFAAADISACLFLDLPEMRANSSNKFFDSLAAGKPVLLNYGGWQEELVEKWANGIACRQMSSFELATELKSKIRDKAWLRKSGKASEAMANQLFDRDLLASKFERVLCLTHNGEEEKVCEISTD